MFSFLMFNLTSGSASSSRSISGELYSSSDSMAVDSRGALDLEDCFVSLICWNSLVSMSSESNSGLDQFQVDWRDASQLATSLAPSQSFLL